MKPWGILGGRIWRDRELCEGRVGRHDIPRRRDQRALQCHCWCKAQYARLLQRPWWSCVGVMRNERWAAPSLLRRGRAAVDIGVVSRSCRRKAEWSRRERGSSSWRWTAHRAGRVAAFRQWSFVQLMDVLRRRCISQQQQLFGCSRQNLEAVPQVHVPPHRPEAFNVRLTG